MVVGGLGEPLDLVAVVHVVPGGCDEWWVWFGGYGYVSPGAGGLVVLTPWHL